jgi:hypothetical protein
VRVFLLTPGSHEILLTRVLDAFRRFCFFEELVFTIIIENQE